MGNLLKTDSHIAGSLIGLGLPIIAFLLLYGVAFIICKITSTELAQFLFAIKIASIAFNLWPIRFYLVTRKFEQTGRAILLVTFVYIIVYFWLQ